MTVHRRAARSIRRPRAQVDFLTACRTIGLPAPIAEMRFHPARRFSPQKLRPYIRPYMAAADARTGRLRN